jgi:isoamylase
MNGPAPQPTSPYSETGTRALTIGHPPSLGARWNGSRTTVAVQVGYDVTLVEVCTFDPITGAELRRTHLTERLGSIMWGDVPDLTPGSHYGLRLHGSGYRPERLIMDPYALAFTGDVDWLTSPALLSPTTTERLNLSFNDTAQLMPKCVVVDSVFDWGHDVSPQHPWPETIIVETHVKSATKLHPGIPEHLRGTYAGLAHPVFIGHLQQLGVTSIELLPVHQHTDEERLAGLGLVNHWGYNTLGFFAPDHRYSASGTTGEQVSEFKGMVKLLHEAGIEVILDVVYNHTCEGGNDGAALVFRGLDRHGWYRPEDVTGCGNTLDQREPQVLRMILDSLHYWVEEMHVDGFRFDLAPAIARGDFGFSAESSFLNAVAADPVLNTVKLIAEPWDVGYGGYQVGGFPAPWAEWNDRYRDAVRDLWRGEPKPYGDIAARIAGSSDIFAGSRRLPWASVNFVAAHDGMTMRDLCTYNDKHNEANGEDNRDGTSNNRSWNCGVEGPTNNPEICALRIRQQRNHMATLMLSQGTPMFLSGDELGHTQQGNNNAYCQDSTVSWLDWAVADTAMIDFTSRLISLRRANPTLRLHRWLVDGVDAAWLSPSGEPMTIAQWNDPASSGLMLELKAVAESPIVIVINDDLESRRFVLPGNSPWELMLSTDVLADGARNETPILTASVTQGMTVELVGRSMSVFGRRAPKVPESGLHLSELPVSALAEV